MPRLPIAGPVNVIAVPRIRCPIAAGAAGRRAPLGAPGHQPPDAYVGDTSPGPQASEGRLWCRGTSSSSSMAVRARLASPRIGKPRRARSRRKVGPDLAPSGVAAAHFLKTFSSAAASCRRAARRRTAAGEPHQSPPLAVSPVPTARAGRVPRRDRLASRREVAVVVALGHAELASAGGAPRRPRPAPRAAAGRGTGPSPPGRPGGAADSPSPASARSRRARRQRASSAPR